MRISLVCFSFFFFQAEDGIRDVAVTGVQTCALPISIDLVGVRDHFGVRTRVKPVPVLLQPLPQRREVVDLAVLDDLDRAVLVGDRLLPGLEIDDAQPPSPERDLRIDVEPLVVWPSVAERVRHPLERAAGLSGLSVHEETGDPAHRGYRLTALNRSRCEHRGGRSRPHDGQPREPYDSPRPPSHFSIRRDRPRGQGQAATTRRELRPLDPRQSRSEADRKSTRLNSSHGYISYAVFCLKKKKHRNTTNHHNTTYNS